MICLPLQKDADILVDIFCVDILRKIFCPSGSCCSTKRWWKERHSSWLSPIEFFGGRTRQSFLLYLLSSFCTNSDYLEILKQIQLKAAQDNVFFYLLFLLFAPILLVWKSIKSRARSRVSVNSVTPSLLTSLLKLLFGNQTLAYAYTYGNTNTEEFCGIEDSMTLCVQNC